LTSQTRFQAGDGIIFSHVQINEKNRMFRPFFFQFRNRKPLKKLFPAFKIRLERGYQKALSETTRTTQKIRRLRPCQLVNIGGFVNIDTAAPAQLFKILNTDGKIARFHS
jgi:hypothetical protein